MRHSTTGLGTHGHEGENRCLNSELWHACAGPLVSLPAVGSKVVYFPQGHSEQVAASTNKEIDTEIPSYSNLPPQLICRLHNVTMHADVETDEVYAQMTLQPLNAQQQKECLLESDLGIPCKQPTNYFCKTLTASDTSTHGGFSVPRRAAEKVFPPLDFSQTPPAQELRAKDLHDNEWKFRHIFRGQPKRHLLTTGWSVFVSAKRLVAGDSVLFIWNEKGQLLLGIRRANRPQAIMPSSVLSSDSMHIGLLAAAAHAASTNTRFTIFYNPRASPSEFVILLSKYLKAVYHTRVSVGMRFRMLFETEESSVRRYMGTITGIGDLDPSRWPNSHWRSVKVGWDESTTGERQQRVSLWEIEPLTTFPMYPSPYPLRLKRPWPQSIAPFSGMKEDESPLMWMRGNSGDRLLQPFSYNGFGVNPWLQHRIDSSITGFQSDMYQPMVAATLPEVKIISPENQLLQLKQQQHFQVQQLQSKYAQMQEQLLNSQHHSQMQALQQSHRLEEQSQQNTHFQGQLHRSSSQHNISGQPIQTSYNEQQQSSEQKQCQQAYGASELPLSDCQPTTIVPSSRVSMPPHETSSRNMTSSLSTSNISVQNGLTPFSTVENSHALNIPRTGFSVLQQHERAMQPDCQISNEWLQKQLANNLVSCVQNGEVEANLPSHCIINPSEAFSHYNMSQQGTLLQFNSRGCAQEQGVNVDAQNHVLFGVNIDSSLIVPSSLQHLRNDCNDNQPETSHCMSNFVATSGAPVSNFQGNTDSGIANCLDDNEVLPNPESTEQINMPARTFIKVYRHGSIGRSLDISRFSSYPELRRELGRMFGLANELEDPRRSGWQLVFVDKENDALLVGDDPWDEFVNSVWFIKILSPSEVQQLSTEGLELWNSLPVNRQIEEANIEFITGQDTPNPNCGIPSVVSLDY